MTAENRMEGEDMIPEIQPVPTTPDVHETPLNPEMIQGGLAEVEAEIKKQQRHEDEVADVIEKRDRRIH